MRKLLTVLACAVFAGCSSGSVEIATWAKADWPYRSVAYQAVFQLKDRCVTVAVDGVDYLAVFPEGTKADTSGIRWGNKQAGFGEKISIGGAAFDVGTALSLIGADIPEVCNGITPKVWATVF